MVPDSRGSTLQWAGRTPIARLQGHKSTNSCSTEEDIGRLLRLEEVDIEVGA